MTSEDSIFIISLLNQKLKISNEKDNKTQHYIKNKNEGITIKNKIKTNEIKVY